MCTCYPEPAHVLCLMHRNPRPVTPPLPPLLTAAMFCSQAGTSWLVSLRISTSLAAMPAGSKREGARGGQNQRDWNSKKGTRGPREVRGCIQHSQVSRAHERPAPATARRHQAPRRQHPPVSFSEKKAVARPFLPARPVRPILRGRGTGSADQGCCGHAAVVAGIGSTCSDRCSLQPSVSPRSNPRSNPPVKPRSNPPVHVVVNVGGEVVVDDVGDVGDVQATGRHISGHQHGGAPRAEAAQGLQGVGAKARSDIFPINRRQAMGG